MFTIIQTTNFDRDINPNVYKPRKNTFKILYHSMISNGIYIENESAITVGNNFDETHLFTLLLEANKRNICVYVPFGSNQRVLEILKFTYDDYHRHLSNNFDESESKYYVD